MNPNFSDANGIIDFNNLMNSIVINSPTDVLSYVLQFYTKPPIERHDTRALQSHIKSPGFIFENSSLNCIICHHAAIDLVIHKTCNKDLFCGACISQWRSSNNTCPRCRQTDSNYMLLSQDQPWFHDIVHESRATCVNCNKEGIQPADWNKHSFEECCQRCEFCNKSFPVAALLHHMKHECLQRIVRCPECSYIASYATWNYLHKKQCEGIGRCVILAIKNVLHHNKNLQEQIKSINQAHKQETPIKIYPSSWTQQHNQVILLRAPKKKKQKKLSNVTVQSSSL